MQLKHLTTVEQVTRLCDDIGPVHKFSFETVCERLNGRRLIVPVIINEEELLLSPSNNVEWSKMQDFLTNNNLSDVHVYGYFEDAHTIPYDPFFY